MQNESVIVYFIYFKQIFSYGVILKSSKQMKIAVDIDFNIRTMTCIFQKNFSVCMTLSVNKIYLK